MANIDLEKGTVVAGPLWIGALILGIPIALFFATLVYIPIGLFMPSSLELVAPLYCDGAVEATVIRSNPTSGEASWSTDTYCTEGGVTRSIGWPVTLTMIGILAVPIWVVWTWSRAARRRRRGIVAGQPIPAGARLLERAGKHRGLASDDAPGNQADPATRLAQLRRLRDRGLIDAEDYAAKKAAILEEL